MLAQATGAPVLVISIRRLPDYRHQVVEISAPVAMEGETATAFGRCVAAMDAAIKTSPAHWYFWFETDDLARLATCGRLGRLHPAGILRLLASR